MMMKANNDFNISLEEFILYYSRKPLLFEYSAIDRDYSTLHINGNDVCIVWYNSNNKILNGVGISSYTINQIYNLFKNNYNGLNRKSYKNIILYYNLKNIANNDV